MFFLRLTLYTCAFYSAIALPIVAAELALTYWFGGFGIHFHGAESVLPSLQRFGEPHGLRRFSLHFESSSVPMYGAGSYGLAEDSEALRL